MSCHPIYWVALQQALGIPSRKVHSLMEVFGSPEAVFQATNEQLLAVPGLTRREGAKILAKPYARAKEIWNQCKADGIGILTPDDDAFPDRLRNIPDMPCVLYYKGTLPAVDQLPVISIVGTRKPSRYGEIVAGRMASVVAVAGMTVVSGGAVGIDSVAHKAALSVGGTTIAVLGCGISYPYLMEQQPMRDEIAKQGAVISEYPPKSPATRYTFPARNRLIAALSLGTVVVEAGDRGGSLITADFALEQGKDVFALPGNVMSPNYKGSNRLISDGATAVFSGLDILNYYAYEYATHLNMDAAHRLHTHHLAEIVVVDQGEPEEQPAQKKTKSREKPVKSAQKQTVTKKIHREAGKCLSEPARRVYNMILDADSITLSDIIDGVDLPSHQVLRELTNLELEGLIEKDPAGHYTTVPIVEE